MECSSTRIAARTRCHTRIYAKAIDCLTPSPDQADALAGLYDYLADVSGAEYDQFCSRFPYKDYIELAMSSPDPDVSQIAIACLAQCTFSSFFPRAYLPLPTVL